MITEYLSKVHLVIISGLAGSGKTVAIDALEDIGFYCIDNLPAVLFEAFAEKLLTKQFRSERIGVALDARDPDVPEAFIKFFDKMHGQLQIDVVFLEAQEEILLRRFKETRRIHPLSLGASVKDSPLSLPLAIQADFRLLTGIRERAAKIIDTSEMTSHYLRHMLRKMFASDIVITSELQLNLISFGFKYGIPKDVDTIFDARCFTNPHYISSLRRLTGLNQEVQDFVFADPNVSIFVNKIVDMVKFLFPLYSAEGKSYFALGVGCTGGKHRSVSIVERLAAELSALTLRITIEHRHFDRE